MRNIRAVFVAAVFALAACSVAFAQATPPQDPGITQNGVIGEVVAVDVKAKQLFVKTDAGSVVTAAVADNSRIMRNPPGETGIEKAAPMTLAEMGAGDRVFARGVLSDDRKTVTARILIVNTKADLEKKREADRAEWRQRGIVGVVSALNPQTKEITIQTRTPEGPKPVVIPASGTVKFRRYAPDSVKFSDAKPSTFEELKVGDQLRAKGNKSADGASLTPEEVVTGSFRTSLGTVTAVNAEKNELTITQTMQGNAPLTIVVRPDSVLKQVPADLAQRMMGGGPGGPGGGAPGGPAAGAGQQPQPRPAQPQGGQGQPSAPGAGGPGGRPGGPDIQQMLEMLPAATLADLKPGQMIVVSSTVGADPTRVTAIQLVAGIEPLVAMMRGQQGGQRPGQGGIPSLGGGGGINFGFGIGQP